MTTPFTGDEIRKVIAKMKPNENPECDEIPFELIKYAPETINGQIAEILLLFIHGKLGASRIICMNKFLRSHVCLHCQGRNRRWQLVVWHLLLILIHFQNYNVMALLRYATIISVRKLAQVIKSNTTDLLRIQRHSRKILKRILAKGNWNEMR